MSSSVILSTSPNLTVPSQNVQRGYKSDDYYKSDKEEEESTPYSSSGATLPQEIEIWTKEEIFFTMAYYGAILTIRHRQRLAFSES